MQIHQIAYYILWYFLREKLSAIDKKVVLEQSFVVDEEASEIVASGPRRDCGILRSYVLTLHACRVIQLNEMCLAIFPVGNMYT